MRYPVLLFGVLTAALCIRGALACGYHAGVANAAFDVVHPNSLSVAVAIRQATDRGVLEPRLASLRPGWGYRRAVRQLRGLQKNLARIAPRLGAGETTTFTLVFVRSRLETRYTVRSDGAGAVIHTPFPGDRDAIVLSDESVVNAIINRRLTFDAATEQGLLRFFNDRDGKAYRVLRAALGDE